MSGKRSDIFIATGLLIFCLILALFTLRIPSVSAGTSAGPSFVPWLMLGCIAVFSLLMIVSNLISAKRQSPAAAIGGAPEEATGEADTEKEADARLAKGTALRIAVFISAAGLCDPFHVAGISDHHAIDFHCRNVLAGRAQAFIARNSSRHHRCGDLLRLHRISECLAAVGSFNVVF